MDWPFPRATHFLKDGERQGAAVLYRSLQAARDEICSGERNPAIILAKLRRVIDAEPRVALDYAEIADARTLEPLMTLSRTAYVLIAARVGDTRLIDNALVEPDGEGSFSVSI